MTAGAACTVCRHPRVAEIDADLRDPVRSGYTRIAGIYSLRKDAVRRHKQNGHMVPLKSASQSDATISARNSSLAPEVPGSGDLSAPGAPRRTAVEVLEAMLAAFDATDTSEFSPRELNVYNENKRRTAVDLAKYQVAIDREGPAQKELRALEEMVILMDEALERFPEAREAVAVATHAWKANREKEPTA